MTKPVPYVLVSMDVMKRHFLAAIPEADRLLKEAVQGKIKPYENCIAFALALKGVCLQFGWKPQDFLDLIAQVEDGPPNG